MEATAAVYTGEPTPLVERVNTYLDSNKMSKAELALAINYSRSAVSRFLTGDYRSPDLEAKLETYLQEHEGEGTSEPDSGAADRLSKPSGFFASRDAQNVLGVCSSCQQDIGLGIVVGRSGYGKTYALQNFAQLPRVAYVECDDTMGKKDLIEAIEKALGIPSSYGTIWKRVNGIRQFCNTNHGYLIIIDEADKLINKFTYQKMEILRGIFDQADVGMVIAGEPALEAQIKSYLNRFANRVDCYASLNGLAAKEVESFLEGYDIDADALKELVTRTRNKQTGCFRLLDRTLKNVFRILNETKQKTITLEVISKASDMMML